MLKRIQKDFEEAEALRGQYQEWDHSRTADVQLEKLQKVWNDCVSDVPYYSALVRDGRAPSKITCWDDFYALPELNREILQDQAENFIRRSGPPDLSRMTGGSTGNPVHFGVWHKEDRVIRLLKLTLWLRAGYGPGDRLFLVWGHSHLLGTGWRRHLNHLIRNLKDCLFGYRRVDAYRLDAEKHIQNARSLIAYQPAGLIGYASALDSFVRANQARIDDFRSLGLRFIMPCAEPLPKPDSLDLLRSAFDCPVVQEFSGVDFGHVASQYDDEPFIVFPDQNVVEAESSTEGETGEAALVTSLYPRYLPLIRYRQGDLIEDVVRESHGHVRSFKFLKGRVNDMIDLPSGVEIHSVAIFHCIHQESEILNIQMVLKDGGPHLRLATLSGVVSTPVQERIRLRLRQVAAELENIPIEGVTDIETTRAGKRRWFVDKRTSSAK